MQVQDYEMTKEDANGGTTIRAWLNETFQAIATNNSGDEEPVTTYPFMWWVDTNDSDIYFLKMRNHANSEWLTLCAFTVVDGEIVFNVTKAQVGLSNVDNTSDALKPLSDAAIAALATKLSIATSALCTQVSITDDPNNATQEYILTKHANCPDANVSYWYIHTIFYASQTSTSARTQTAYSYSGTNAVYIRHNSSGAWTAWTRVDSVVVDATSSAKGVDFKGLLAEFEVTGSPTTTINITGLDINAHKSYRIEVEIVGVSGGVNIYMFINGDNTVANYYMQMTGYNNTTVSTSRQNQPRIGNIGGAGVVMQGIVDCSLIGGIFHYRASSNYLTGSTVQGNDIWGNKVATVANITSIQIVSSTANHIGVGSKIRIYRGDV